MSEIPLELPSASPNFPSYTIMCFSWMQNPKMPDILHEEDPRPCMLHAPSLWMLWLGQRYACEVVLNQLMLMTTISAQVFGDIPLIPFLSEVRPIHLQMNMLVKVEVPRARYRTRMMNDLHVLSTYREREVYTSKLRHKEPSAVGISSRSASWYSSTVQLLLLSTHNFTFTPPIFTFFLSICSKQCSYTRVLN